MSNIYGFDIEANTVLPFSEKAILICASLVRNKKESYIYVMNHPEIEQQTPKFFKQNIINIVKFTKVFYNEDNILVGHNLTYDNTFWESIYKRQLTETKIEYKKQIRCKLFDTMIAQSLIDENFQNTLENLAFEYLTDLRKIQIDSRNLLNLPLKEVIAYNKQDAMIARYLYEPLLKKLKELNLIPIFNWLMKALNVVIKVQIKGINLDYKELENLGFETIDDILTLERNIQKVLGNINLDSPKQLRETLFSTIQKAPIILTPKGEASTSEESLTELLLSTKLNKQHKNLLENLLQYRKKNKILSTYLTPLQEKFKGWDSRIHTSYYLGKGLDDWNKTSFGTVTGRLSSRNPNLQNVINDLRIRGLFIPTKGMRMFKCDHSQLELRIAAFLSQDKVMLDVFRKGLDIHTHALANIYELDYKEAIQLIKQEEWKAKRRVVKTFNFALIYGAMWFKLQEVLKKDLRITLSEDEIKRIMKKWAYTYYGFSQFKHAVHNIIKKEGYVRSETGRVRRFVDNPKEMKHYEWKTIAEFQRQGLNAIIQCFASDITLLGWIFLEEELSKYNSSTLLSVHDSIDGEYDPKSITNKQLEEVIKSCLLDKVKNTLENDFNVNVENLILSVEIETNLNKWS